MIIKVIKYTPSLLYFLPLFFGIFRNCHYNITVLFLQ